VPQGSCLRPVEFITYTESVATVFGRHNINHHLFADDKQAYANTLLEGIDDMRGRLSDCITDISNWCSSHRLQLNENKTELAWFGKRSRLNKLVNMEQTVTVGASIIQQAGAVRDLGVLLDILMNEHMTPALRQLHWLPVDRREDFKLCTQSTPVSVRRILPTWCVPSPSTR